MDNIIDRSFSINLRLMRIFGYYPPENCAYSYKIQAYIKYLFLLIPAPLLGILYLLFEENVDMEQVNYNAAFLAETVCFTLKFIPFITNGGEIRKCINYFQRSFFEIVEEEHTKIMKNCIKVCHRNNTIFLICVTGGFISWSCKPFFLEGYRFPIDVLLPFNGTSTLTIYCSVYIYLSIGVCYTAFSTAVIDPLIGGLAYHATCQIKILKNNLQHLNEYSKAEALKNNYQNIPQHIIIYERIQRSVDHHNAIVKFIKLYEECFSFVVFCQFVGSVFVICFCCLQLSKINSLNFGFFQLVSYFLIILGQIYFYCYFGSTLFEENKTLTDAVFTSEWYNYDAKSKKALITLMERSQRPIIVTAGKLVELSLNTFTLILKRSYSLMAVLKNYQ